MRSGLVLVTARLAQMASPDRLADELVRRGAREARALGTDRIVLTLAAPTRPRALSECAELLSRVGVTPLETSVSW